jgi:exopolysaccharide biosynthesis protein
LSHSAVTLESVKAKNSLFAREKTSVMAKEINRENHFIAGAVNADFFERNGTPVGAQVINGLLINVPTTRSVFGMTEGKEPFIDIVNWNGQLLFTQEIVAEIMGINRRRKMNDWFLYNSYYTNDTLSFSGGTIIHANLFSDDLAINDTIDFQITEIKNIENVILKPDDIMNNEIILIGPLDDIPESRISDKIQILINLPPVKDGIALLLGGLPRLIRDGNITIEWKKEKIRESFSTKRHPRTAVGYTKDKQKVLLFVVDGRQPGYSMGMTLPELAAYMLEWGIYQGINLDGGGSSAMVVQGEVANSPSDPNGERPVANALMVVNMKPSSSAMKLNIIPDDVVLSSGTDFPFEINLQDINFHPVVSKVDSVLWSCCKDLGYVDTSGLFTADSLATTGFLYVQKGMMIDSAKISIINDNQDKP